MHKLYILARRHGHSHSHTTTSRHVFLRRTFLQPRYQQLAACPAVRRQRASPLCHRRRAQPQGAHQPLRLDSSPTRPHRELPLTPQANDRPSSLSARPTCSPPMPRVRSEALELYEWTSADTADLGSGTVTHGFYGSMMTGIGSCIGAVSAEFPLRERLSAAEGLNGGTACFSAVTTEHNRAGSAASQIEYALTHPARPIPLLPAAQPVQGGQAGFRRSYFPLR